MTLKLRHKYISKNVFKIMRSHGNVYTLCLMPRRVTMDTNLRIFQYTISNNVLYLNEKLFRFKIFTSPLSSFCNCEDETPIHFSCSCNQTKSLSSKFQELLNSEILLPKSTPLRAFFFFQIIKKILKSLTICILYLRIICLTPEIQEK